ncbi:MAG: hypothetical protein ACOX8Q_01190 [Christensenellales bacterium]
MAYQNADLRRKYTWIELIDKVFENGGIREVIIDRHGSLIDPDRIDDILSDAVRRTLQTDDGSFEILTDTRRALEKLIEGR